MKQYILEKLSPVGTVVAAAGCPVCFPALAAVGSVLGLGAFAAYENEFLIVMQVLMGLNLLLFWVSYRRTRYLPSFLVGVGSGGVCSSLGIFGTIRFFFIRG